MPMTGAVERVPSARRAAQVCSPGDVAASGHGTQGTNALHHLGLEAGNQAMTAMPTGHRAQCSSPDPNGTNGAS